jgi:hypothetical protein
MVLQFEIALLLCTAICTVFGLLSTREAARSRVAVNDTARAMRKQVAEHELIVDQLDQLRKRMNKLAGTVYREEAFERNVRESEERIAARGIPEPVDVSPELEAMLALQRASTPPGG